MKINNLKINSFGGLENKNIEFNKFNLICGENESGKSTLLNYIINIFYGISKNKNGKNISDFDRFYPWNSSDFSGQINYDLDDGSNYRVYRNFENKDIYIYDKNNTEISNLFLVDKKLGSQFLKDQINLDREVLEKTFIINQNSLKIPKNDRDELIQKISNLIESGSEEISYKKLQKKLGNLQLENVGSDRSSDRPYNIIKENYEKISEEISYLKNVNDDKYLINKKNNDIDEKMEINSEMLESVEIAKNEFKKFNNINEKINIKEKYIRENFNEKENDKKDNIFLFIFFELFFSIFFVLNFIKFKNNFVSGILLILMIFAIILYFYFKNIKYRKNNNIKNSQKLYDEINNEKNELKNNIEKFKMNLINKYGKYVERYFKEDIDIIYNKLIDEKNLLILDKKKLELEYSNILPKLEKYVNFVEEKDILENEIVELSKKNDGYNLAKVLLEESYNEIKNSVIPKFFDNLGNIIKLITNGKYIKVYLNDNITVEDCNNKIYDIERLSYGTIEEIYFSIRISIVLMICDERVPVIIDEGFAYFDDKRLRVILDYLYKIDNQVILFSSSNREKNILDMYNYDYNFVQL